MTAYEQGFLDKCAEFGVSPYGLLDAVTPGPSAGTLRRVAKDPAGMFRRGIDAAAAPFRAIGDAAAYPAHLYKDHVVPAMERLGDAAGRDWAAFRASRHVPTLQERHDAERMRRGYNERALGWYRRGRGVQAPGATSGAVPAGVTGRGLTGKPGLQDTAKALQGNPFTAPMGQVVDNAGEYEKLRAMRSQYPGGLLNRKR